MTRVYFVRHAQPEHDWKEDRSMSIVMWRRNSRAISVQIRSSAVL